MKKSLLIIGILVVLSITGLILWQSNKKPVPKVKAQTLTVYRDPDCGCCIYHGNYLKSKGFDLKIIRTRDMDSIKKKYNIPRDMQSCHTTVWKGYFIEGHIPIEAINKLIKEKPAIDGIALPSMPSGAPGMPGLKTGKFRIHQLLDGKMSDFLSI